MALDCSKILQAEYTEELLSRFLRYVRVWSESSSEKADSGVFPSTEQQWDMAAVLNAELKALGLSDVHTTEHCYTYARLDATKGFEEEKPLCLLSHIDTVDEVTGKNVCPIVHKNYSGKTIELSGNFILDSASDEHLKEAALAHDTIITTDGNTLLGADDKAGISEIITALDYLLRHKEIPHGTIEVLFSPDEETGHGMDKVPLELLRSKCAYTVDGGHLGGLEMECFNAVQTTVSFCGKSAHTGSARGCLVNAVEMAAAFISHLPHTELPETTQGYEGFFAPLSVEGSVESSFVELILRDFDLKGIERRKALVEQIAATVAASFGGKAKVEHTTQYFNMRKRLEENPDVIEKLVAAYKKAGVEPIFEPIRGGTDGSRLTELGIPTPNIFTGAHNLHSRLEWASLSQMVLAVRVLIELCAARKKGE